MPDYGVTRATDLPERVRVYEVGARDGLQNEQALVPTEVKVAFLRRLLAAGHSAVETTSFVRPEWVPQLADAAEVLAALGPAPDGVRMPVLVPNRRGLDRALAAGVAEVAVFASATETFARKNLNRGLADSLDVLAATTRAAVEAGLTVRGYVSMCFGDPWEGAVDPAAVARAAAVLHDAGAAEISLGDTIGVGTPGSVVTVLDAVTAAGVGVDDVAVHFHDTYGQALSNTVTALRSGVSCVDSSAGGLGGCPYAESATGNLATEDLLWALDHLGVETGVDLASLVETSAWMATQLGRPSPSRVVNALATPVS